MTGPVGVITGAGSGIGAATALEFARLNARLVLASLPTPGLHDTVAAVEHAGGAAIGVEMDVRDPDAVRDLIDGAAARFGQLDFLIANAGVADQALAVEGDPEVWRRLIETNLLGAMYCVRYALPHMQRQRSGHILLMASTSGRDAYVGEPAYIASKFGLITPLTRNAPKVRPLIESIDPLKPADVARALVWAFQQPPHVVIHELALRALTQPESLEY
jgi:NADP-dependent 3-hydroxy acid dehydrogenase YdfG